MAVNEIHLPVRREQIRKSPGILGLLEIFGAPMLLLQFLIGGDQNSGAPKYGSVVAALGVLYIGGWICGAVGMFRQRVYGETFAAKLVFWLQLAFLALALLFSLQETFGISYENGGGTFFFVCDMGYPLSHLFMLVVGVFVWRAKNWKGFTRLAPLLVGAALPLTMIVGGLVGITAGMILFGVLTTVGLGTIGYSVYSRRK